MVQLDPYISDLNALLDNNYTTLESLSNDGFSYMFASSKATHGLLTGRAYYNVILQENTEISNSTISSEEMNPHQVKVGFSCLSNSNRLGEEGESYCYCSNSTKCEDNRYHSFGRPFFKGDKVGAYIDLSNPTIAEIFFTLNGYPLGCAFKIRRKSDSVYFPHVSVKNMKVKVIFGEANSTQNLQPSSSLEDFAILPGFKLFNHLDNGHLKRGPVAPSKPELIMTVGLPGCGKSTFAHERLTANPDKKYNILGTDSVIDRMFIGQVSRRQFYLDKSESNQDSSSQEDCDRNDKMSAQSAVCFSKLMKIAMNKCRNYILDQTNIFAYSRSEKAKAFMNAGFKVIAAVIVLEPEELQRRSTQRTEATGKFVPDSAIHELMANFFLPTECENCIEIFTDVIYIEGDRHSVEELSKLYRQLARSKGCEPNEKQARSVRKEVLEAFYEDCHKLEIEEVKKEVSSLESSLESVGSEKLNLEASNGSGILPKKVSTLSIDFDKLKSTLSQLQQVSTPTNDIIVTNTYTPQISSQPVSYNLPTPSINYNLPVHPKINQANSSIDLTLNSEKERPIEIPNNEGANKFQNFQNDSNSTNYGFNLNLPENSIPIEKMRQQIAQQKLELEKMNEMHRKYEAQLAAKEEEERRKILARQAAVEEALRQEKIRKEKEKREKEEKLRAESAERERIERAEKEAQRSELEAAMKQIEQQKVQRQLVEDKLREQLLKLEKLKQAEKVKEENILQERNRMEMNRKLMNGGNFTGDEIIDTWRGIEKNGSGGLDREKYFEQFQLVVVVLCFVFKLNLYGPQDTV